jgi:hypothetical protein
MQSFFDKERRFVILIFFMYSCLIVNGQRKWDGEAGDGLWSSGLNWVGNVVPSATEDVLLDHSALAANYTVLLPSGPVAVTVRSLTIFPSVPRTIQVLLPATNTAIPGFIATGSVYGLIIGAGGIFRNSSGASAGTPVNISDSIKIENGGLYIHNTSRAHAANVTVLSRAAGTEQGSFQFDVPGGAGYTVSIAGRIYGNLILSATAAGGTKSYTSTGSTSINIKGQFRINAGASYSLNFSGAFIVHGDLVHHGDTFDISSGLHSNSVICRSNIDQSGVITESGRGLPVLEFAGSSSQLVSSSGSISESITIRISNTVGVTLQTPLAIRYKLQLGTGNIKTTLSNILVIHDGATCSGGSVKSFVEGPVRKIGDDDFDFPLGKPGDYAPVSISGSGGATLDEFEAEYFIGNPVVVFGAAVESPPVIRVSRLEYWNIRQTVGGSPKKITASIRTYSNATLLEKLVITRWDTVRSIWKSEGNSGFNGIATGTLTSDMVYSYGNFTVASTDTDQNPLPVFPIVFTVKKEHQKAVLSWRINKNFDAAGFEILKSGDGKNFELIQKVVASANHTTYHFLDQIRYSGIYYFRIKATGKNGSATLSDIQAVYFHPNDLLSIIAYPAVAKNSLNLVINVSEELSLQAVLVDTRGRVVQRRSLKVYQGSGSFVLDLSALSAGVYYLSIISGGSRTQTIKILKL